MEGKPKFKPCHICNNARVDADLADDNDLSYSSVGFALAGCRMMFRSGGRKPLCLRVEELTEGCWELIAYYRPRFCPNCGRPIVEYPERSK